MADNLELALAWLGLDQYHERFMQAGFDTWETLLEITENDLEVLDVDLGHRRKLQKEIQKSRARDAAHQALAAQRGLGAQQYIPTYVSPDTSSPLTAEPDTIVTSTQVSLKRSYRHHPKPDPHAPKRPYSAYVLFSNHIRELLAPENMDFPEISRQVGQRWQALSAVERDLWKQQAQGPRDTYKKEVMRYRDSAEYLEHKQYVDDFQTRQIGKSGRESGAVAANNRASPPKWGIANSYPTPGPTSVGTGQAFSESYPSKASMDTLRPGVGAVGQSSSPEKKMPIQRLRRDSAKEAMMDNGERKPRSKQACEPCRQKKTKCNEERPTCGHCLELDIECYYSSGKETKERRRVYDLSNKLDTCQKLLMRLKPHVQGPEQILIQEALELPPIQISKRELMQETPHVDGRPHSPNEVDCSDDDSPGMGLVEASCQVNEDDYAAGGLDMRPKAFAGQSSDVQWMRRLTNELNREGSGRRQSQHPFPLSAQPNLFAEDNETAVIGDNVDPFQVPIKSTADLLVDGYFRTVHASFPILHRSLFLQQYSKLEVIWHKPVDFEDRMFVTTLQLVFAIGAVHARLAGSVDISDERDHMLYFARARMLALDSGVFNDQVHLGQTQVFGLGAMYCLVTDQINRAWIASGVAIRSAQSLGLHLHNITPSVTKEDKEYRSRVWFALLSFERTLGVMSGRPSMVQDWEYNLTLPPPESAESTSPSSQSEISCDVASPKAGKTDLRTSKASRNSMSEASHPSPHGRKTFKQDTSSIEATYFKYHLELSGLAHEAVSQLYSPAIREYRWSKIQALIDHYDDQLTTWKANLEPPFRGLTHDFVLDLGRSPLSVALAIQFYCVRAIVNRPCLYRRERTTFSQSSYTAVSRCIGSARSVIELVITSPTSTLIHHGPKWWLLLHHTKRALTVVLLELAFRAEHMPSEAEELLAEAKRAVAWLRDMAQTSKIAEQTWMTMSCLLVKAARRVGIDAGDDAPSNNHVEQQDGWSQPPNEEASKSLQHPVPTIQYQAPLPMQFGLPTDSPTYGDFLPNNNLDPFRPSQDPLAYQNFMELEAFDQFSFEPMTTGQSDMQTAFASHQPAEAGEGGAQMSYPQTSLPMPHAHGPYPTTMPQLQQQHHQPQPHRAAGMRADGYLTDDWFGFDPARSA